LARRFRLGLLGRRQAGQAIICPARDHGVEYQRSAVLALLRKLCSTNQPGLGGKQRPVLGEWVEPLLLEVLCRRLWEARFAPPAEPPGIITAAHVKALSIESALEGYYADTAKAAALAASIPEREVREWIEDRLILPSGLRALAQRADTAGLLPEAAIEVLQQKHFVQLQMLGDSRWFELTNDRFVGPVQRDNARWFAQNLAPLRATGCGTTTPRGCCCRCANGGERGAGDALTSCVTRNTNSGSARYGVCGAAASFHSALGC
jgi:hypothetical protein